MTPVYKLIVFSVLVSVIFVVHGCSASKTLNFTQGPFNPENVTPKWLNFDCSGMSMDGDFMYVTEYYKGGMHIFDLSEYPEVKVRGRLEDVGYFHNIKVSNGLALIHSYDGLQVADVSDPDNPVHLCTFREIENIWGIEIIGNIVYVAGWAQGLMILDISNPADLKIVSKTLTEGAAVRAKYDNGLLYVGESPRNIEIYDVTNLFEPIKVGQIETVDQVIELDVDSEHCYVLDKSQRFYVFEKTSSEYVGSITFWTGIANDFEVQGDYVYLCGSVPALIPGGYFPQPGGFIYPIDISDPTNPVWSDFDWLFKPVVSLEIWSDKLFAEFSFSGVYSFDVGPNGSLEPGVRIGIQPPANYIQAFGDVVYSSDGEQGIRIIDPLPPENYHHVGLIETIQPPRGFDIGSGLLVVATEEKSLRIFDLDGKQLNRLELSDRTQLVKCADGYAYVGIYFDGIAVVDFTPPESAHVTAVIPIVDNVYDLEVDSGYLFAADLDNLYVFDLSNPASPVKINRLDGFTARGGLDVHNGHLYVGNSINGLSVLDIDPIEQIRIVKELEIPVRSADCPVIEFQSVNDVKVSGKYAYVAINDFGLACYDIDPIESAHVVSVSPFGGGNSIEIVEPFALLGTDGGIHTIRLW